MSKSNVDNAALTARYISKEFIYDSFPLVKLDITCPTAVCAGRMATFIINTRFNAVSTCFLRFIKRNIFPQTVRAYQQAVRDGSIFFPLQASMAFTVTLNCGGLLSVYYDQEIKHGRNSTVTRFSDTFSLKNGSMLELKDILGPHCRAGLISQIKNDIDSRISAHCGTLLPGAAKLCGRLFSPDNFYLTDSAVNIYYSPGQIAPESEGFIIFQTEYCPTVRSGILKSAVSWLTSGAFTKK